MNDEFGYGTKRHRIDKPSVSYKGRVGRQADPVANNFDFSKEYSNTEVFRSHRGDMEFVTYNPDKSKGGHKETWDWTGNHTITAPGGEEQYGVTGTYCESCKQGAIKTVQYASDEAVYNDLRQSIGNLDNQKELVKGGGHYTEVGGHRVRFVAGMVSEAQAMASGRGHYGLGKHTMNFEGGIGLGVNKGSDMKIYQRMEPDGTYHLQVKPSGEEGGNAVIKITPDGAIHITTKSTITVESKGTHTIKAPLLKIDAPVKCTKTIEADNSMTSPHFHGCADRAKGPC